MCVSSENKNAKNPKQNRFACFSPVFYNLECAETLREFTGQEYNAI